MLDREFAPLLATGVLVKSTAGGIVIGVIDHGQQRLFAYGAAPPDSIFEIGSVTKSFTGLLLAQLVEQKKVAIAMTHELRADGPPQMQVGMGWLR